jgi:hypothetical protein
MIHQDRMAAEIEGDFVVFLIGMRVNKLWKLHKWLPVASAMGPMLAELSKNKDLGLLGFHTWVGLRGPLLVQYWRSPEHLEAFARGEDLTHRPAWRRFYQKVALSGDVGIWHETYEVRGGGYETVYGNMPRFGLANAGDHVKLRESSHAAERRALHKARV